MKSKRIRKEIRVPVESLPPAYKSFGILTEKMKSSTVMTADASLSGYGFYTDTPSEEFKVGSNLELYPIGKDKPVHAKVVYSKQSGGLTRIGAELIQKDGYSDYKKDMMSVIDEIKSDKKHT